MKHRVGDFVRTLKCNYGFVMSVEGGFYTVNRFLAPLRQRNKNGFVVPAVRQQVALLPGNLEAARWTFHGPMSIQD